MLTNKKLFNSNCPPTLFSEAWNLIFQIKFQILTYNAKCQLYIYKKHLEPIIGNLTLKEITPIQLEYFKNNLLINYQPQTVKHIIGLISRIYKQLIEWNLYAGNNPANQIKIPKDDNKRYRYFTSEEIKSLFFKIKKHSLQTWQISLLSLTTGMRAGEIFSLYSEHINFKEELLVIINPKNKKNRTAFLPKITLNMLQNKNLKQGHLIFTTKNDTKIKSISRTFPRVVKELGFNDGVKDTRYKAVFHTLRHTFASWLAINDQSLYLISELLGHSDLTTTKRYAHLSPQKKKSIVSIFDKKRYKI